MTDDEARRTGGGRRVARGIAWLIAGAILVIGAAGLSFLAALRLGNRSNEVEIPDLGGMTAEEAELAAARLDLVVEVASRRHDPRVASGRVLQQDPAPGASVRRGRRVRVVVSLGGNVLEVPLLVGEAERKAALELRQDGFEPGEQARAHSSVAASGTVLAQEPPPGTPALAGTRVHRLVSAGPRPAKWVMPDFTGVSLRVAEAWIERAGCRRGPVRRLDRPGSAPGTVVGQLPLAGYPLGTRDVLEMTVAR